MNIAKLKENKGISMTDVVVAMLIFSVFVGLVATLYFQIMRHSNLVELNALAIYYAIKVAEDVDKLPYEEIDDNLINELVESYELEESFNIEMKVNKYNETDRTKQDILKIIAINVKYTCFGEEKEYELKKLKVKEI